MKQCHKKLYVVRIVLLLGVFAIYSSVKAQARHEISLNAGGGLSTLSVDNFTFDYQPSFGATGGLGYTFFFSPQLGIGTGIDVALYRSQLSKASLLGALAPENDPYNPGYTYQIAYEYDHFEENQQDIQLQIPLFLQFQTAGTNKFYFMAGGKIGYHLDSKYKLSADRFDVSGTFDFEGQEYVDGRHGFGSSRIVDKESSLDLKQPAWMGAVEAGMKWRLNSTVSLYTAVYADYCFTNLWKKESKDLINYHFEGPDYITHNGAMNTSLINSVHSMACGIKIRLSFDAGKIAGGKAYDRSNYGMSQSNMISDQEIELEARKAAERAANRYLSQNSIEENTVILTKTLDRFGLSKAVLTEEMKNELDKKVQAMQAMPAIMIVITGYTCNIGPAKANEQVGLDRANTARSYMIKQGVEPYRISTASKGSAYPIASNNTEEGRLQNRRLEFTIAE